MDKLDAHRDITENSLVMEYDGRPAQGVTCLTVIENNFKIRYPLTSRRHELMQMKQPRGESMSTHSAIMKGLMLDADISTMGIEELMSTLLICSCTNEELKDELLKLATPQWNKSTTQLRITRGRKMISNAHRREIKHMSQSKTKAEANPIRTRANQHAGRADTKGTGPPIAGKRRKPYTARNERKTGMWLKYADS